MEGRKVRMAMTSQTFLFASKTGGNWSSGKETLVGVFGYVSRGMQRATSSRSYAVYSHIGGPFYARPRFDLAADMDRAGNSRIGKVGVEEGHRR